MAEAAERMKRLRQRRRERGLRALRLVVPDHRSEQMRRELAEPVARLDPQDAEDVMKWIEAVSEYGDDASR